MTLVGLAVVLMGAALPTLPALLWVRGNAATGRGFMGPERQGTLFETALRSRWFWGNGFDHFPGVFRGS